jgi:hypothetical protein
MRAKRSLSLVFLLDTQLVVCCDNIKLDEIFNIDDTIECFIYKWKRISIFDDYCIQFSIINA